ncbi:MAG: hypothetical protein AAB361_03520 [Patescibacteria group bacterium]
MKTKNIKFRQSLFWDVDLQKLDIKKHAQHIIGRILEFGNENDVKWMFKNYNISLIKKVLSEKKDLSLKSANFWALILKVPKNKILCLKKSYQKMQKMHWPY